MAKEYDKMNRLQTHRFQYIFYRFIIFLFFSKAQTDNKIIIGIIDNIDSKNIA